MFSGYTDEYDSKKLYKYYSYNDCMDNMFAPVINHTLRYRNPIFFNDPYDCYIAAKVNGQIQSVRSNQMNGVFVCSLTAISDAILMWSHYASNHEGFVIEYDYEELKKINYQQMEVFSKVIYSDDIIVKDFFSSNAEKAVVQAIFHKSLCWNYENEIRSVIYNGCKKEEKYIDITLNSNAISAVLLGSHFIKKREGKIPAFLKRLHHDKKLYYMQLLSDKYHLEKRNDIKNDWFE